MKSRKKSVFVYSEIQDPLFKSNCKQLLTKLPVGSEILGYQIVEKSQIYKFDIQSVWLDIHWRHEGERFKSRESHKNNQFLKIKVKIEQEESNG